MDWDIDMGAGGFMPEQKKYPSKYKVVMATKWVKEKNGYPVRLVVVEEYVKGKRTPEHYSCCLETKDVTGFLFSSYNGLLSGAERKANAIISRNRYDLWAGVVLRPVKNSKRLDLRPINLDYEMHRKLRYLSDERFV